jgi:hypothetical protein
MNNKKTSFYIYIVVGLRKFFTEKFLYKQVGGNYNGRQQTEWI